MRRWPLSVTARDLATQFVILSSNYMTYEDLRDCKEIGDELFRRVGGENARMFINQARETLKMLSP